jgi:hypothetical protein
VVGLKASALGFYLVELSVSLSRCQKRRLKLIMLLSDRSVPCTAQYTSITLPCQYYNIGSLGYLISSAVPFVYICGFGIFKSDVIRVPCVNNLDNSIIKWNGFQIKSEKQIIQKRKFDW